MNQRQRAGGKGFRTEGASALTAKEISATKVSSRVSLIRMQGKDLGQRQPVILSASGPAWWSGPQASPR